MQAILPRLRNRMRLAVETRQGLPCEYRNIARKIYGQGGETGDAKEPQVQCLRLLVTKGNMLLREKAILYPP